MLISAMDHLGERLIHGARDPSIKELRMTFDGRMKSATARKIMEELATLSRDQLDRVSSVVPALVDIVLHNVLRTIDENEGLEIAIKIPGNGDETRASEVSDGLPGELYGDQGWIAKFSAFR